MGAGILAQWIKLLASHTEMQVWIPTTPTPIQFVTDASGKTADDGPSTFPHLGNQYRISGSWFRHGLNQDDAVIWESQPVNKR